MALREAGETFDLVPPTSAELEEIVTRPVAACQPPLAFEQQGGRSLSAQLVADAKGGDALPLLQMTLSRLYAAEAARGDGVLRFTDYRGMDAAVTETANEALGTLNDAAKAELPALITALVADVAADPLTGGRAADCGRTRPQKIRGRQCRARGTGRSVRVERACSPPKATAYRRWCGRCMRHCCASGRRPSRSFTKTAVLIRVRHTLEPIVREWLAARSRNQAAAS